MRALCNVLISASSHVKLVQLFVSEEGGQQPEPVCVVKKNADDVFQASPDLENVLVSIAQEAADNNSPLVFRPHGDARFAGVRSKIAEAQLQEGAAIPFTAPDASERITMVVLVDIDDYFNEVGLEPFIAYACLCSVLLEQTVRRQRLSEFATFDHLTGLLNRRALAEVLEREHVRAERYNRRYSLLFCDLDFFKRINDTYGHVVGDRALQGIAKIAGRVLREGDWIGRWGGEEFVCILPDASEGEAERIAQRLRNQVLEEPLSVEDQAVGLTLSIGVACFPSDGYDINSLLVHADAGLSAAKQSGRNCVRRYAPGLD